MNNLTRASLNLTHACNLRCTYCFTNGCTFGDMPKEIAFRAVDWLFTNALLADKKEQQVEISFWGGEPLLKWDLLKDITLYAENVSQKLAIPVNFGGTTNGTLLTPEKFNFLDEHKIFFMVSFDGTEETHDYHRKFINGVGSQKIIEANLKEVLKHWPFFRVRMSPFAERIDHFYEDCKYIFDLGCNYLMFSPVYESNFTEEKWLVWEDQCRQVIDYMINLKSKGRKVEIEHFKSYMAKDNSKWPCGAGRNYIGIDIDGAIYPCHRFNKFDDNRPWQDKEVCIGHIDHGITRPEFREKFIDFSPQCGSCIFKDKTPCHGGCYGINYDFTGDIELPYIGLCRYVQMQKSVSEYYKNKTGDSRSQNNGSCICNFEYYTGPIVDQGPTISLETIALLVSDLNNRVSRLEKKNG